MAAMASSWEKPITARLHVAIRVETCQGMAGVLRVVINGWRCIRHDLASAPPLRFSRVLRDNRHDQHLQQSSSIILQGTKVT